MDEIQNKVNTDPDYVNIKRFDYSLEKLIERYPDGVPGDGRGIKLMAAALALTEEEVLASLASIVVKLRRSLKVGR